MFCGSYLDMRSNWPDRVDSILLQNTSDSETPRSIPSTEQCGTCRGFHSAYPWPGRPFQAFPYRTTGTASVQCSFFARSRSPCRRTLLSKGSMVRVRRETSPERALTGHTAPSEYTQFRQLNPGQALRADHWDLEQHNRCFRTFAQVQTLNGRQPLLGSSIPPKSRQADMPIMYLVLH